MTPGLALIDEGYRAANDASQEPAAPGAARAHSRASRPSRKATVAASEEVRAAEPCGIVSAMSTHTPDAVLGLAREFMRSRVLLSAAELDLFTLLSERSLAPEQVASAVGADPRGMTILLDSLAAMDLLDKKQGVFHCQAGGTYSFAEIRDGLAAAGFEDVRLLQDDSGRMDGVVTGRKAGRDGG